MIKFNNSKAGLVIIIISNLDFSSLLCIFCPQSLVLMALPTLKSYYGRPQSRPGTARISMLAHKRMIADENQQKWEREYHYFKSNEARNQKLRDWTSDSCYRERWAYFERRQQ